jgi:tetratricopeptide (TPR) repeat protein
MSLEMVRPGLKAPNAEQWYWIVKEQGVAAAIEELRAARQRYPGKAIFSEESIRSMGNEMLWSGQLEQAIEVFRLAIEAHPESLGLHLELAEAYAEAENVSKAIEFFERVLVLDPGNERATQQLRALGR